MDDTTPNIETEDLRKVVLESIKQKLVDVETKYNTIIDRLETEVQDDRKHAQDTYAIIKEMVGTIRDSGGRISPGVLQALNGSVTNLQNSTQREKEILQEIAKKQQQLEVLYEMSKPQDNEDVFDKDDLLE